MDNINSKNLEISKILILFGVIVFIISAIDLIDLYFPLKLSSPEWVFSITQSIIASVLAPALSLALLFTGIYLAKDSSSNKKMMSFAQCTSFIPFIIGLLLILNLLMFSLSMKAYETKVVSSIQMQKEETLTKLSQLKNSPQLNIPEDLYNKKIVELNKMADSQIKSTKKQLLIKDIKSIIELILYIALYLGIGKFAFDSAKNNLLKLKFAAKK